MIANPITPGGVVVMGRRSGAEPRGGDVAPNLPALAGPSLFRAGRRSEALTFAEKTSAKKYISQLRKPSSGEGCVVSATSNPTGVGRIKLSDGAVLKLKILIVDVRESGFSPFGGVNFDVKVVGGVAVESVPEEVRKLVTDKPLIPPEPPKEGWEIVDIVEQKPAEAWEVVQSSRGEFAVRVVAEGVMASRNTLYRSPLNEPVYWVSWVYKVSWRPSSTAGWGR
jgi:hypothetical protein